MTLRSMVALCLCLLGTPAIAAPAMEPVTYPLITNGTVPTYQIVVTGGSYIVDMSGTFGGTTLGLSVITNGVASEYDTWTSAPSDKPCFNIPSGSIVRATLTGGSPSGMTVTLGGVGSGGCATAGGAASNVAIPDGDDEALGAKADTVCATSTGTCTLIALAKKIADWLEDVNAAQATAVPLGANDIGHFTPTITSLVRGTITSAMTGTTSTSLLSAPAGGIFNYITNFTCSNADADTDTVIALQDGSGGTTFYSAPAAKLMGGFSISFPVPLKQPTAATALYVVNETTGATTKCSASGFTR
jgi:hypothetical protein